MRITQEQLDKMRAIRDARNISTVLPGLVSIDQLKSLKTSIWADIRRAHSLPADMKFKVELDGDNAGEIRRKDNSQPFESSFCTPAAAPTAGVRYVVIDDSDDSEQVYDNVDDVFAYVRDNSDIRIVKV